MKSPTADAGLPFIAELDDAMDSLPRPQALQLENAVMDVAGQWAAGARRADMLDSVAAAAAPFPRLLSGVMTWMQDSFPLAI